MCTRNAAVPRCCPTCAPPVPPPPAVRTRATPDSRQNECRAANAPVHSSFCPLCRELGELINIDFERFIEVVPFRQ